MSILNSNRLCFCVGSATHIQRTITFHVINTHQSHFELSIHHAHAFSIIRSIPLHTLAIVSIIQYSTLYISCCRTNSVIEVERPRVQTSDQPSVLIRPDWLQERVSQVGHLHVGTLPYSLNQLHHTDNTLCNLMIIRSAISLTGAQVSTTNNSI